MTPSHTTFESSRFANEARSRARNFNRAEVVEENLLEYIRSWRSAPAAHRRSHSEPYRPGSRLKCGDLIELVESQFVSRLMDVEARRMRARGEGFYTIGSAGHEGNAVVARLTNLHDMAFLHYRSGAFVVERSRQAPDVDIVNDVMLSFAASANDPISGGRHKVWGSKRLNIPPQTSTIASHLPKAMGAAVAIERARRLGRTGELPEDAVVVCSFGDASLNHAVAQTAFNAAGWATHLDVHVPIVFVCEDNGMGISVPTPDNWVELSMGSRPGIHYVAGNGLDVVEAYCAAERAIAWCRRHRSPVFLHLRVARLLGHAGSDAEHGYSSWEEIEAREAQDPMLRSVRLLLEDGILTPDELLEMHGRWRARVAEAAAAAAKTPRLTSVEEIIAPLSPTTPGEVVAEAHRTAPPAARLAAFGGDETALPENRPGAHLAELINRGLADILAKDSSTIMFGEDVGKKGGVYHVTAGLQAKFGKGRVFDTLLDETIILGLASGYAHLGFLPIPEIQYLAYYHNAEDQIRGEACSLQFFSQGQFRNGMMVRIQGWGYQKGFGGHFHNDNAIAVLRDVPGLVVATPSRGDDAVRMMRTLVAMAKVDGQVSVFIEPIALYMTKDLHDEKDGGWTFDYPAPNEAQPFGHGRVYEADGGGAADVTIVSFANGLWRSLRAARMLAAQHGVRARVIDLMWLAPLPVEWLRGALRDESRVLIVDESRRSGGVAEGLMSALAEDGWSAGDGAPRRMARLTSEDTFVPLGPAADLCMPDEERIVEATRALVGK